ncbi:hypothetical protein BOTBODRAFT_26173 [Botryobasidium botryosum FD-172 SS1]|uniref:ABC1 atypical kinase-like domain-containing protein n=1 Tax=Botryobasidium botryosum (strain FD-172 SS1) TaxID=930990 RepID=A0A067ND81_BOTB1|nr:hypothetical protein BOTBODRAFT_26173 [Botryobasidium botryosum FD-172 SS1]
MLPSTLSAHFARISLSHAATLPPRSLLTRSLLSVSPSSCLGHVRTYVSLKSSSGFPARNSQAQSQRSIFTWPLIIAEKLSGQRVRTRRRRRYFRYARIANYATLVGLLTVAVLSYDSCERCQHTLLAIVRCARVAKAVILGTVDYKRTFSRQYGDEGEAHDAYSKCHRRTAERILDVLQTNGGIYIKLGQHTSSIQLLPIEWTSTLRPLQDQCIPTPYSEIEAMFVADTGRSLEELFSEFDPEPIGVASLAQVHLARDRESDRRVAVKIQHPHLDEFAKIDMIAVTVSLKLVKQFFPEFEFSWLGEEIQQNLPLELDFVHEAYNAHRATQDFAKLKKTSLYIPQVLRATKRTLIMEYIDGARVDDLVYLAKHDIDRNKVSQELQRIFSRMVYINGFFHADPHPGNLLIRPAPPNSRSPYNFEIALLDHGLYFDIEDDLRINYARLWLSLIASGTPKVVEDRKKYAELVGNIQPDMYPIFETAITGRAGLEGGAYEDPSITFKRAGSMLDLASQSDEELEIIRNALMEKEGLILSLFDMLRRVPRRVLMILKLNDLTRHLDNSLATTHSRSRIFLIVARYCSVAVWQDERNRFFNQWRNDGLSLSLLTRGISSFWAYHMVYDGLRIVEWFMDTKAQLVKTKAYLRGLYTQGWSGAKLAAAGLA